MRTQGRTFLFATAAGVIFASSGQAAESAADPATEIGELIVTAQKRSETLHDVPASVSALSGPALEERGVSQAADLKFLVPGMQVGTVTGTTNVAIRGIAGNLAQSNGPQAVAIHIDGVYQPVAAMGDLAQADLERVEVLRGPQGTLYGRNANAGVINFITKAPTDQLEGYVQLGYGNYNETHLQGVVNVPLGDRVRARAVVDWRKRQDGFVKNVIAGGQDLDDRDVLSGRIRVSADVTDRLKVDLIGAKVSSDDASFYITLRNTPTARARGLNPYLNQAIVPLQPFRTANDRPSRSTRDYTLGAATVTWNPGALVVKSITGWQRIADEHQADEDGTNLAAIVPLRIARSRSFTQEVNVSGSIGPLDAVVGGFYLDNEDYYYFHIDFPLGFSPLPPGSVLHTNQLSGKTKSYAAFTDLTWNVSDRVKLIGGVRLSKDELTNTQFNFVRFGPAAAPIVTCANVTAKTAFDSTTPRAGAQFEINANSNVFVSAAKGFKAGGFNRNTCNQTYEPEKITAYEAGFKNRFMDGRATFNASAFYYDYSDLQLVQAIGTSTRVTNAAKARVKGVEFEGQWRPTPNWSADGNLSLLDAKYRSFVNLDGLAPERGLQDLAGNYLNNAPRVIANLGASYRTGPTDRGEFILRGDLSYRSRYYLREFNSPLDGQSGYTTVNLSAIWDSPGGGYRVRVFATNLTNEAYVAAMGAVDGLGSRFINYGAPRQYGVEVRASF